MDILLLLGQLYALSSSICHLCLEIEIILCNLSLCVSTFLGGNPVFSNTDQINIDANLLQVDNFVEQHSHYHTLNEKGQTVRGQMKIKEMARNAADDLEETTKFKANTTSSLTTPQVGCSSYFTWLHDTIP